MVEITYAAMLTGISVGWCICRAALALKRKSINGKRELQLLLVYLCIVVIVRFTFCPFGTVGGKIQPLLFDPKQVLPFRINLIPFVHLFDYEQLGEAILNFAGNTLMFVPVGIVFPAVLKRLDKPLPAIGAGIAFSLAIEILQLPFFERVSDIDDLLLNTLGYVLGYLILMSIKKNRNLAGNRSERSNG